MGKKDTIFKQIYENDCFKVVFQEDEDAYFYALKENEYVCYPLNIEVYKKIGESMEPFSYYYNSWDREINKNTLNMFIRRFLENPEYRKDFHCDGEHFQGVVPYKTEDGLNKKCKECIDNFNKISVGNRNFKHYAALKTFGIDKYSRLKYDDIAAVLSNAELSAVKDAFEDDKNSLNALRWICRGLSCEDAIRKVKTDLEITNNIRKK